MTDERAHSESVAAEDFGPDWSRAVSVANEIQAALKGQEMVVALIALGLVIGSASAGSEPPDLDLMMHHLKKVALTEILNIKIKSLQQSQEATKQ